MRTTLNIEDDLLSRASKLTGQKKRPPSSSGGLSH